MDKILFKLHFPQLKRDLKMSPKERLFTFMREEDIPIASSCAGHGVCKWCKITIDSGIEKLNRKTKYEKNIELQENERLACQLKTSGNLVISTTYW